MPARNENGTSDKVRRVFVVACLSFAPLAGAVPLPSLANAVARASGSGSPAQEAVVEPVVPGPLYAVPTRLDRVGRVLAPVTINGKGPFRFIIDTGANRAVLSPHVAELLQLQPSMSTPLSLHGVTGSAVLPAVSVDVLQAGDVVLARNKLMPVLTEEVLADADGILGIEGLAQARIDIDFDADTVRISSSDGRERAPPGFLTIPASVRYGGLLTVKGQVGRVAVRAIIDTGAERSLGNTALRSALMRSRRFDGKEKSRTVYGATPELYEGTSLVAPTIHLGDAELRGLEVTFGDLHVFRIWGLEDRPAILIGMDLLGVVQRLIIDYRRSELQVLP